MASENKEEIKRRIESLEEEMALPSFWNDKNVAQKKVKDLQELKEKLEGVGKYDKRDAVVTVFSGAGGNDAEDFTGMLLRMYLKYLEKRGWDYKILHEHRNDHGGYRNIAFEVKGKGVYGELKNESGVHRLVRLSPFNSKSQRHTSFSMVEVVPDIKDDLEIKISESDLRIEFSCSSGPGGQNVNKRETAVRVVHIPTGISVHCEIERNQARNKEKAIEILKGKLYKKAEDDKRKKDAGLSISKTTKNEWGSQIRSYVLHPYKMVKDHRTGIEERDADAVLEEGKLEDFIKAEKDL